MIATAQKPADIERVPCDLEAEECLLGSMALHEPAMDHALANLTEKDFYDDGNAALFGAYQSYAATTQAFVIERFVKHIDKLGVLDRIGGMARLGKLVEAPSGVTKSHYVYYIECIRRASCQRSFLLASRRIALEVTGADPEEPQEALAARLEQILYDTTAASSKPGSITDSKSMIVQALERLDARCKRGTSGGVATGFGELDKLTGGLHKGQLVLLAARTGNGKSVLANNFARNIAGNGLPVLFVSLEMSQEEAADRLLQSEARVPGLHMRQGWIKPDQRERLVEAAGVLGNLPLFVDDAFGRTVHQIASAARLVKRKHGLAVLVVDYLQLVEPENNRDSRVEQVGKISRRLKVLARELQVPILALAQINRQAEGTEKPRLSHLRESGALEQDADVVMLIHRGGAPVDGIQGDCEDVELIVAKQRNGPVGTVMLRFFRQYCRFESAAEKWQEGNEGEAF